MSLPGPRHRNIHKGPSLNQSHECHHIDRTSTNLIGILRLGEGENIGTLSVSTQCFNPSILTVELGGSRVSCLYISLNPYRQSYSTQKSLWRMVRDSNSDLITQSPDEGDD